MKANLCFVRLSAKAFLAVTITAVTTSGTVSGQVVSTRSIKGQAFKDLLSSGGLAAVSRRPSARVGFAGVGGQEPGGGDDGLIPPDTPPEIPAGGIPLNQGPSAATGGGDGVSGLANRFVNDPCLDPAAPNRQRTVQSETSIAVLKEVQETSDNQGNHNNQDQGRNANKTIVVGYNNSAGFYNNTRGLSGYSYSVNGGKTFIDGGGLPPLVKSGAPAGTPGSDAYFGDPVVVVHNASETFYYSSIYQTPSGYSSISVNRGVFQKVPPQSVESQANSRCLNHPELHGIPDSADLPKQRIVWGPPVVAVAATAATVNDFLDKEWLYVDQHTGELYLTYTRFGADGSTPLELVRSKDGGHTWLGPTIIVPNLDDTFNQATQVSKTPSGRVIVAWFSRTFSLVPPFREVLQKIEAASSGDDGVTFTAPVRVAVVNPQAEPRGYNRGRRSILNAPYIAVDGNSGNVYLAYFSGMTPVTAPPYSRAADIFISRSTDNGLTWKPAVKVNDDSGQTSHVFPTTQVDNSGRVYAGWLDRRHDSTNNILTDTWSTVSDSRGTTFEPNVIQSDVSTSWFVRADARPNFGDYNSSDIINGNQFALTWADGRFPPPGGQSATPDVIFTVTQGPKR